MRSQKAGSCSRAGRAISPITAFASVGVSDDRDTGCSRCSTMPESECTIDVNAPDFGRSGENHAAERTRTDAKPRPRYPRRSWTLARAASAFPGHPSF